jgi:hypothetical protein
MLSIRMLRAFVINTHVTIDALVSVLSLINYVSYIDEKPVDLESRVLRVFLETLDGFY